MKAAIIGLGMAGFLFELDPLRTDIWSHSSAFNNTQAVRLVAAVDIDSAKRAEFKMYYPDVEVFTTIDTMLKSQHVDIASVCVPTESHLDAVRQLAGRVKAIFCEKPLANDVMDAKEIVSLCKGKDTLLSVNYIRRWDKNFIYAKQLLDAGEIGELRTIAGYYPGEIFNIGTHLFDIMSFFAGKASLVSGFVDKLPGEREAFGCGMILYENGVCGFVVTHGIRKNALFEINMLGSKGRLKVLNNGRTIMLEKYEKSPNYSGYFELTPKKIQVPVPLEKQRMVRAIENIVDCIRVQGVKPYCTGEDALHAQLQAHAFIRSHQEKKFVSVDE